MDDNVVLDDHRADEHIAQAIRDIAQLIQAGLVEYSNSNPIPRRPASQGHGWHPVLYVTYFLPNEMYLLINDRQRQHLDLTFSIRDPFVNGNPYRTVVGYAISALVNRRGNRRGNGPSEKWYWKPATASFLMREEQTSDIHLDPDEIFATLTLAKAAFKQLCGARPNTGLRVRVQGHKEAGRETHREIHALINANQAADHVAKCEELRRRRTAPIGRPRVVGRPGASAVAAKLALQATNPAVAAVKVRTRTGLGLLGFLRNKGPQFGGHFEPAHLPANANNRQRARQMAAVKVALLATDPYTPIGRRLIGEQTEQLWAKIKPPPRK